MAAVVLSLASAAAAVEVLFTYEPPDGFAVDNVSLRGSFNGWGETPMKRDDGTWTVSVDLEPGQYEYKFFINGE
ncbi:MAG: glycogen-binding domain-containing protein, partial [Candidatus Eisenbacteria bacterium]|nr:glycogen-binding domain-containing protein [Candidatus Eisenbacteria bacterium]